MKIFNEFNFNFKVVCHDTRYSDSLHLVIYIHVNACIMYVSDLHWFDVIVSCLITLSAHAFEGYRVTLFVCLSVCQWLISKMSDF